MNASAEPGGGPKSLIDQIGDGLTNLCLSIAAVALICIVAINGVNVVARYLFGSPFSWAEELMLFLMILAVFAGAIAVSWRNLHIRIDTFVERSSPPVRLACQAIGSLVTIGALGIVTSESARVVTLLQSFDQRSDALNAPAWIPQSFVTIGLGTIALLIAIKLVVALTRPQQTASSVAKDKP